jgi:hypothetical protein
MKAGSAIPTISYTGNSASGTNPFQELKRGKIVRLRPMPGILRTVHCQAGSLWVTSLGNGRDLVLDTADLFHCDPEADILIEALGGDATFLVALET